MTRIDTIDECERTMPPAWTTLVALGHIDGAAVMSSLATEAVDAPAICFTQLCEEANREMWRIQHIAGLHTLRQTLTLVRGLRIDMPTFESALAGRAAITLSLPTLCARARERFEQALATDRVPYWARLGLELVERMSAAGDPSERDRQLTDAELDAAEAWLVWLHRVRDRQALARRLRSLGVDEREQRAVVAWLARVPAVARRRSHARFEALAVPDQASDVVHEWDDHDELFLAPYGLEVSRALTMDYVGRCPAFADARAAARRRSPVEGPLASGRGGPGAVLMLELLFRNQLGCALLHVGVRQQFATRARDAGIRVDERARTDALARHGIDPLALESERARALGDTLALAQCWASASVQAWAAKACPSLPLARLRSRPKVDGSRQRALPVAETLARVRELAACAGITRVADITDLDRIGIPVFSAVRPASLRKLCVLSGKGTTPDAARTSAMVEAYERHVAEQPRTWPARIERVPARRTRGYEAFVTIASLIPSTLTDPERWRDAELEWVEGFGLTHGQPRWVPLEEVALAQCAVEINPYTTSSGIAAGNNLEEAVCHALCELIERDSLKQTYFGLVEAQLGLARANGRRIELDEVPAEITELVAKIRGAEMDIELFDCTSDIGVPSVLATLLAPSPNPGLDDGSFALSGKWACTGLGAHPDPVVAVTRAITEAVQTHSINIQGAREDLDPLTRQAALVHDIDGRSEVLWDQYDSYIYAPLEFRAFADAVTDPNAARVRFTALGGAVNRDILDDVRFIVDGLARVGLPEIVVVPLTPASAALQVVRVLVPGLEHIGLDRTGWRCHRLLFDPTSVVCHAEHGEQPR